MSRASRLAAMVCGLLALGVVPAGSRGALFAPATALGPESRRAAHGVGHRA